MGNDVAIIGAGIVGCCTAYFLAREGVNVTVHDPSGIAAGASGRNNGIIEHPYECASTPLFDETVEFMRELLGESMPERPVGALLLAPDQDDARELVAHYSQFPELEPALLSPAEATCEEPLLAEGMWGCLLQTGYPISPAEATNAVAERAREAGAEFVLGRPVELERLRASAGDVVVAAGAWSTALLSGVVAADAVRPLWGVIVLIDLPRRPRHPIIEGTVTRGLTTGKIENVSPFTLLDSPSWLAVGSTLLEGDEPRAGDWSARLLGQGSRYVPSIAQAPVRGTLVCARPKAYDNRPILGRVPGQDRLWLASGHGGRGMSLGAGSGRLMADAIIAGSDAAIPAALRAARLSR
ncbi:MAG TPA: FAD-dependent oxidoreductase [Solirubrobacteraceae bacterium]|jgi:D-amino-acid dehydrogenase|nr:FAD-dependent oxidoreductase [Solirubrobacteraceae bacterium]